MPKTALHLAATEVVRLKCARAGKTLSEEEFDASVRVYEDLYRRLARRSRQEVTPCKRLSTSC